MPTADLDIISMRQSCLGVPAVTGAESNDIEENKAHWDFYGGEEQSLTRETHGIAHSLAYEHDRPGSMSWATEMRAQRMSMESIENVNPFPSTSLYDGRGSLHVPEIPESQSSFHQLFGATPQTSMSGLSRDLLASPHPFCSSSQRPSLFPPNAPTISTLGTIEGTDNLGMLVFRCSAPSCIGKTFNRWQDFTRHYNGAHVAEDAGDRFWCQVPGCERAVRPFPRKDKLNAHVRKMHMSVIEIGSSEI